MNKGPQSFEGSVPLDGLIPFDFLRSGNEQYEMKQETWGSSLLASWQLFREQEGADKEHLFWSV